MILNAIKRLGKVKTELAVLFVLVPVVVILGALLVRWPDLKNSNVIESSVSEAVEKLPEAVLSASAVPTISMPVESVRQVFDEVTLITERGASKESWQVEIEQQTTVENVLITAADKGYLDVGSTDYGGSMGIFVESLGGIANDNIEKVYWHLYVNNVLSPVGATQAIVKAGDEIIWKYEKQHDEN